jgi:excisionase family DNA binding protein
MTSLFKWIKGVSMMEELRNETQDRAREYPLKLEDVADFLDVDLSTLRGWVESGRLPCSPIGSGSDMRFRMDDVMNFVLKCLNE